jgi:L-fucose dehydrogenase
MLQVKLSNKVAIITGGSKGIGLGCAQVFLKHDADVVIASRDRTLGESVASELSNAQHTVKFVETDVTREGDIRSLIDATIHHFGRLDCLVNNAGWHPPPENFEDLSTEDFESLLKLNLTSTFIGCKYSIPHLRRARGCIINVSSEVALIGQQNAPSYVTSKAGQIGLTRALALDLAPHKVRVNAICPAGVMTPLMQEWADSQYDPKAALEIVDSWHPLGRMATIEEIGEVCAFLASDESAFITGQAICVDGGAALGYRR